jgi:lipoate-protein ligase A
MVLGRIVSWNTAAEAFLEGFSSTFNIHFERCSPTEPELRMADELVRTKYNSSTWTLRM